ncbi:capsular polysaccharide biosynthesis protein [Aliisedimentitalea scapharcae]|uniref:Capsular polysaccharide biosynthesis protein n=1 Tax=Aliisedimentitalea scapharcae TaxID=1524259 RepID=A0ABZ2XQF7_9RHOB
MTDPMRRPNDTPGAGRHGSRLFVYNGGFLTQRRARRILALSGYKISLGLPQQDDLVGIWGNSPTAHRGLAVASKRNASLLRVEDAFLRSLHPGRAGEPPLGLLLDTSGVHFDPAHPSDLERLLASHPLDDAVLLNRARAGIERIREAHLSKYSGFDPDLPAPEPGYVLVVDQTFGDASVRASKADRGRFLEMLVFAQEEHPGTPIVIKTHPESQQGYRHGYFETTDQNDRVFFLSDPISPWALMDGAVGVYTVSSQMGFEAILAGHKPRVFGQPFYAGWGLTQDEFPLTRRQRSLTRAQLFAAAMILYPQWYDPHDDRLGTFEQALGALESQARAWRQDHRGWTASGMRLWKRKPLQTFFGRNKRIAFTENPPTTTDIPHMVWAGKADGQPTGTVQVEDGFLRSRGLGAELVPPLSLVTDSQGIYYDPTCPSDLERWIIRRATLSASQQARADQLIHILTSAQLSKYNLGGDLPDLPTGHRILVPGQVEDDASIKTGTTDICTNLGLLQAVRTANPDAILIYKPHPDVEAGLRTGAIDARDLADVVATHSDPVSLLEQVDEVWTMTSLIGFEALLRGIKVTTLGVPFYAGWGLTRDYSETPDRRRAHPTLAGLVHAALIDYPRYLDPVTGLPCTVEVAIDRLQQGKIPHPGWINRSLSKLQGLFATYAHLWR